ncbi:hypothetical protein BRADI_2g05802v3 [Brachypodium distachyon]|uniref:F-box domain-containing protein n=1 Tax=Brachypodium distachyon TaxID=15368 RepID=A0A0Q3IRX8_BRADI|nr:hypothetical protein BRADI_2g05802v3 [Brachypodium distachyon]
MLSTPYGEDAIRAATEADAAAQNASTHVHSIINSVVEKHSAIWGEEFSSFVSSMKLIHQRRVSLMAAEISDTVSSLMHNHQTNVDDSSSKVQDQLLPFSLEKKKKEEKRKRLRPFIASEHQVPHPDPHVASECQVPEATVNSTDAQQNQANDNTEGLISDDIVNVPPSPIQGQFPNFSTGIHAVASDNNSHRDNIAATTPADANLNGGSSKSQRRRINKKRKREQLEKKQFLFCRPSCNPMLLRGRTMVHMSEAGDPLDSLPVRILADILGRVADIGDIAACRLASRALLAATYQCPSVRLDAATHARCLRKGRVGVEGTPFCELMGNLASLIGAHLRSLSIDVSKGQGCPDEAMWVEEGEFDEADDLHLTNGGVCAGMGGHYRRTNPPRGGNH